MKIEKKLNLLKVRFKKIRGDKFAYNTRADCFRKSNMIICWYLIFEPDMGYSIMPFKWTRSVLWNSTQWSKWIKEKSHDIFTKGGYAKNAKWYDGVLPSINNKYSSRWQFEDLICWTIVP